MESNGGMKNRILGILENFCDYIELGVLCALCAVPVVSAFSSLSAAMYTKKKCFEDGRAGIAGTFFKYIRRNAGKEIIVELIFILYLAMGCIEVIAADQLLISGSINTVFAVIRWMWFLPGLLVFPWIVTYESEFNDTVAEIYRKSVLLSVSHLGESVIMTAGLCLLLVFIRFFPALFVFVPVPVIFLFSRITEPVYRKLIEKTEEENKKTKAEG